MSGSSALGLMTGRAKPLASSGASLVLSPEQILEIS